MARAEKRGLRSGFTTGTAATAATKAALTYLYTGQISHSVEVQLLIDRRLTIDIQSCHAIDENTATCTVLKDGGDDPDVTHRAVIGATVCIDRQKSVDTITITSGVGVGRVTKPGLEILPGSPAITSGPMKMIRMAIAETQKTFGIKRGVVSVEIFAPRGAELAKKTLNARLGILGGISILGTTGVVKPLSHAAYIATIEAGLSVARAAGLKQVVLTTGRRSERFAQNRWPEMAEEGFIQMGDFFAKTVKMAAETDFESILIAIFFGKAVKMAQGIEHTHARSTRLTLKQLAQWALEITENEPLADHIKNANTARQVFDFIKEDHPALIDKVGREIVSVALNFGQHKLGVRVAIFDFDGTLCFDSQKGAIA